MRQMAHTLTSLKHEIKDSLVAIAIILSLPASYSTLQTILMSHDSQTTEDVIGKILSEESLRWEQATQSAFLAKFKLGNKSKDKSKKDGHKKKPKCDTCRKHHNSECRKVKEKKEE
jgi:hypothetical protein